MKKLLRAIVISYFGAGSAYPARTTYIRLGVLGVLACLCSWYGIKIVIDLPLYPWPYAATVMLHAIISMQLCLFVALMSARSILDRQSAANHLLILLPLRRSSVWGLSLLPHLIVAGLVTVMFGPAIALCAHLFGLSIGWCVIAVIAGCLSGLGLMLLTAGRHQVRSISLAVCVLGIELASLHQLRDSAPQILPEVLWYVPLAAGILCGCAGLYVHLIHFADQYVTPAAIRQVKPWRHPRLWFMLKTCRNSSMRTSLTVAVSISLVGALLVHRSPMPNVDMAATVAALLAASCTSDIRTMCRQHNPAEVTALRGTFYYLRDTIQGCFLCILACSPLLYILCVHQSSATELTLCFAYFFVGLSTGHAAGSWVAPQQKDISAQFFAVFASTAILWALFQLPLLHSTADWQKIIVLVAASFCLISFSCTAEYKRNPYKWRKNHA